MKRIVLIYGFIAGVILVGLIASMVPLVRSDKPDFSNGELIGYSSMVLAFLFVFFGVRSYRQKEGEGSISFGRAFQVGILITLVASLMYVVAWQVVFYGIIPDFSEKYAAFRLDEMRAEGASVTEVEAERAKMAEMFALYQNPLFNAGITFLEVFPVGLVMSLMTAAILRRKPQPGRAAVAATAV